MADDYIILDTNLTKERLAQLISFNQESSKLDYKESYDISSTQAKVELTKYVVAMANSEGGYIVFGVADDGKPVGIAEEKLSQLDESDISRQIHSYIDEPIKLRFANRLPYNNALYALLLVMPSDHSPIVFTKIGQYRSPEGRDVVVFKDGDVFVRHGSSSERWNQQNIRNFTLKIIDREKNKWMEETRKLIEMYLKTQATGSLAKAELDIASFLIDDKSFEQLITHFLREKDNVALRQLGYLAESEIIGKLKGVVSNRDLPIEAIDASYLQTILDKLAIIGSLLIKYKDTSCLEDIISNFFQIYTLGKKEEIARIEYPNQIHSFLWKEIIIRVYSLGAQAVYFKRYEDIPSIILHRLNKYLWARHALTMLSRAKSRGLKIESNLCTVTTEFIKSNPWLFSNFGQDEDAVVKSLCQFDFLQCLLSMHEEIRTKGNSEAYPSFGIYPKSNIEPIVENLVRGGESRKAIPGISDDKLAWYIYQLDKDTASAFGPLEWDAGRWARRDIERFLAEHKGILDQETPP